MERWLLAELEMDRAAKPEDEDNRMTLSYVRAAEQIVEPNPACPYLASLCQVKPLGSPN